MVRYLSQLFSVIVVLIALKMRILNWHSNTKKYQEITNIQAIRWRKYSSFDGR